ncbi:MAG: hypothetical protein ACJAV1_001821 [Paraglaciecola sp.]
MCVALTMVIWQRQPKAGLIVHSDQGVQYASNDYRRLIKTHNEYSETVGFKIIGPNKSAIFIPDINKWSQWNVSLVEEIAAVDDALIDATFYADGELSGRDMSKIPHTFVSQTMATLNNISQTEKNKVWFIHMNHTNPLFDLKSDESQYVNVRFCGLRYYPPIYYPLHFA